MKIRIIGFIPAIMMIALSGCAQQEIQKPAALENYSKAYVSVETSISEAVNDAATLQNLIIGELNNRNLYESSAATTAQDIADGLVIRVDILNLHRFNGGRGIDTSPAFFENGSDGIGIGQEFSKSKVIGLITLEDGATKDILSTFPISGDSPKMTYSSVDWRWGDLHFALQDFAKQLADTFISPPSQGEK